RRLAGFGVCFLLEKEGAFMQLSRRGFLRSASIAAAATAVLELPALAAPPQVEAAHRGDIPPSAIKLSNNENAYGLRRKAWRRCRRRLQKAIATPTATTANWCRAFLRFTR